MKPERLAPVLLFVGYALLSVAWLFTNPPSSAPDVPAALVKTLAAGRGELLGSKPKFVGQAGSPAEADDRANARVVTIPAGLSPSHSLPCNALRPLVPAGCPDGNPPPFSGVAYLAGFDALTRPTEHGELRRITYLGSYPPFTYVIPGLVARLGTGPDTTARLALGTDAALSLGLIALAIFLIWSPTEGTVSLLGVVVAVTPMALFSWSSTLSGSGLEIAGGVCTVAALLRLRRGLADGAAWLGFALGGTALAASRPAGPLLVLLVLLLGVLLLGPRSAWRILREGGQKARIGLATVLLAAAANAGWELAVAPAQHVRLANFNGFSSQLATIYKEAIGVFGWLDTPISSLAYAAWTILLIVLLGLASRYATNRQRVQLALAIAAAFLITAVARASLAPAVGSVQGRWLLPVAVAVPMLAGELVLERSSQLRRVALIVPFIAIAAGVQLWALYDNGRRNAVGIAGRFLFSGHVKWSPPLGWGLWSAIAIAGALALVGAGVTRRPAA